MYNITSKICFNILFLLALKQKSDKYIFLKVFLFALQRICILFSSSHFGSCKKSQNLYSFNRFIYTCRRVFLNEVKFQGQCNYRNTNDLGKKCHTSPTSLIYKQCLFDIHGNNCVFVRANFVCQLIKTNSSLLLGLIHLKNIYDVYKFVS